MKLKKIILLLIPLFTSCSEYIKVHTGEMDNEYLVVEGILDDIPGKQQVISLSKSLPYESSDSIAPLSGATVKVIKGDKVFEFKDHPKGEKGSYFCTEPFSGKPGDSFRLEIDAYVNGGMRHFEAETEMVEPGFQIDSINYVYQKEMSEGLDTKDGIWQIFIWGKDFGGRRNYLLLNALNGQVYPLSRSLFMDNKYFEGAKVDGFPIEYLRQGEDAEKMYGNTGKAFAKGDVLSLLILCLPQESLDFILTLGTNGSTYSIPLFSPQPANPPTNIKGDYVVGTFAVCSTTSASILIDDPYRTHFKFLEQ